MRLKDKVALITGAGSGIGREIAILFANEGADVVAADLTADTVQETVDAITAGGGAAVSLTGDVTASSDAEKMVSSAVESFGKLDLLVNSAGLTSRHSTLEGASPRRHGNALSRSTSRVPTWSVGTPCPRWSAPEAARLSTLRP